MIPVCVLAAACGVAPEDAHHDVVDLDLVDLDLETNDGHVGGGGAEAHLELLHSGAALDHHATDGWQLSKTGVIDEDLSTVTWTIAATSTAGGSQLVVDGFVKLENAGGAPAPIGNIVINLQTRLGSGPWITRSSNIADATFGDAATSAHVVAAATSELETTFTEDAASGPLRLFDHTSGAELSLTPSYAIPPGAIRELRFFATYDNDVLGLPVGEQARAELLVTHGDAGDAGHTALLLDIDGDGQLGPHEHRVQTVSAHHELTVPAPVVTSCGAVTLHDTVDDITTTGTVTVSDPTFCLGDTEGTVTVQYDGGTDGGTIKNCAALVDAHGEVVAEACDTQQIPDATGCTPGAPGCGWSEGDVISYRQAAWPSDPIARALLISSFNAAYAPFGIVLRVGTGFSLFFGGASAVLDYLPEAGAPAALTSSLVEPTSTPAGAFGGEAVALSLDIVFSDAGYLVGTSGLRFGDLVLCDLDDTPALDGLRVRDLAGIVDVLLGGGSSVVSIAQANLLAALVTSAFNGGTPTAFAQDHLFATACP